MSFSGRALHRLVVAVALLTPCPLSITAWADAESNAQQHSTQSTPRPDRVQLAEAEGCPAAGTTAVVFYRYVGSAEMEAIQRTSKIPMTDAHGNPKVVYFTDCFYSDADDAKDYLALPVQPSYRVEFALRGVRARCIGEVAPAFDEPGGGNECTLNRDSAPISVPVPSEAIEPLQ